MGRIVVGVDGSQHALEAVRWAAREAGRRGERLHVVHLWHRTSTIFGLDPLVPAEEFEEAARKVLERASQEATSASSDVEVRPELVEGSPRPGLVEAARGASLLVVGARGHGGVLGALLGSVSTYALHHAGCPVAIIPAAAPAGHGVVVGIDGSTASRDALRLAIIEARLRSCRVRAVMVWSYLSPLGPTGPIGFDPDYGADEAKVALHQIIDEVGGEHADLVDPVAINELPARGLLEEAEQAELMVVGARGLGGFKSLLVGSVSEQLANYSPVPVIVVHAVFTPET